MWQYIVIIAALFLAGWLGYLWAQRNIELEQRTIDITYSLTKDKLEGEIIQLKKQQEIEAGHLQDLRNQAEEAARAHYEKTMELVNTNIARDVEILEFDYDQHKENHKKEFLKVLKDMASDFAKTSTDYQLALDELERQEIQKQKELRSLSNQVDAAVESNKRALLDETDNQFYRCMISDLFKKEIQHLRSVEPYLADPRPLCKIIWESYYRTSCSALLDRLTNGAKISGIYKITNLENNKVYIGQAVNIADRLRTHIKAGIGIDPTNSELYKDMKKIGVENFMFEILEVCPQVELNDKEKFWISFYHGQDFGYNITKGGSQRILN